MAHSRGRYRLFSIRRGTCVKIRIAPKWAGLGVLTSNISISLEYSNRVSYVLKRSLAPEFPDSIRFCINTFPPNNPLPISTTTMCKFTIIMYPFCGHPYKEVAPKYARDAEKNYGNGVCRRYSIAFCERAKEGMRGPCVRWSSDETSYRLALMELQDTVVKVDYNDCNLEGGQLNRFFPGFVFGAGAHG
ncbi:hypothetical protein DFP73DRAFT_524773 [Morchella snyderi]|nr:hypothetical protein DFP73DRAFT_524773 [Morchella snyderi]